MTRLRIPLTHDHAIALVDAMAIDDVTTMSTAHTVCVGGGFVTTGAKPTLLVDDVDAMLLVMLRSEASPAWDRVVAALASTKAPAVEPVRLAA